VPCNGDIVLQIKDYGTLWHAHVTIEGPIIMT